MNHVIEITSTEVSETSFHCKNVHFSLSVEKLLIGFQTGPEVTPEVM